MSHALISKMHFSFVALGLLVLQMNQSAPAGTTIFTNSTSIIVPDHGIAMPYPCTIPVSGLTGPVSKITLSLHHLTHTYSLDLDLLLVGPGGQNLMVMSDCGSPNDIAMVDLTFDDDASANLPSSTDIVSGTFRPTNILGNDGADDSMALPAPPNSGATQLSVFNGSNPNGVWSLYVWDDAEFDLGSISGGWSITITTDSGTPTCFNPTAYAVGAAPSCVTIGDLNNDGYNDMAVANHDIPLDNRVSVLLNNGDGTFAPSVFYDTDARPYWIALGDVDGDNDVDMAVSNYFATTVSIFLNNGNGTFAPQVTYEVGNGPGFVILAKLNNDNALDIACTNIFDGTVSILTNNGNGTFASQVTYPCGPGPYGLVAADFDQQPGLDLAISNFHDQTVNILMNNGDGTFAAPAVYNVETGPVGNDAADLDNDGDIDLVVADLNNNYAGMWISVLMNNGNGTFAPKVNYAVPAGPYTVKVVDFNADGFGDIVCSSESGYVSIFLNHQDGTFAPASAFEIGSDPVGLDVGDLDGNGTPEVAITAYGSNEVWVLFNQYAGFERQPLDQTVTVGDRVSFTVDASNADSVRWQRDGIDLTDGPTANGSTISGSASSTLTISNVQLADAGQFVAVATNGCGDGLSSPAVLTVQRPLPTCRADIAPQPNGNGVVNVDDLLAVINHWGTCPAPPTSCIADVQPPNGNGFVNVDDLLLIINSWGLCP